MEPCNNGIHFLRTDVVSLFDVKFPPRTCRVAILGNRGLADPDLYKLLRESRRWLFYQDVPTGFVRTTLKPATTPNERGSTLLFNDSLGIGVYSVWTTFPDNCHPLDLKGRSMSFADKAIDSLQKLLPEIKLADRHFPLVGVRIPSDDFEKPGVVPDEWIGRLLTGGLAHETSHTLEALAKANISQRDYERLFLTWTDAVAIYSDRVDERMYELTLLRAVQLFETCIAIRRILKTVEHRISELIPRVTLLTPRPWAVNRVLQLVKATEREFVTSPEIWSVEAERLVQKAYSEFGIGRLFDATTKSCDFLDRRFQWAKTQLFVAVGMVTYLLDKLIGRIWKN